MRKKIVMLVVSSVAASVWLVGGAPAAHACAEPDPMIGCIGPCPRFLRDDLPHCQD